jgi:tripartite-type tricarboxylate transporter receptor subunit TctC
MPKRIAKALLTATVAISIGRLVGLSMNRRFGLASAATARDHCGCRPAGRTSLARIALCAAILVLAAGNACAQGVSFRGRTVTMVIGYAAGGGTDAAGRLIAALLARHLPGDPTVIVQNVPGADGMTAMNLFVQQPRTDGTLVTMGSGSQAEPTHYRRPQSRFDPTRFVFVGGGGRAGAALVIGKSAEARLADPAAEPAIMGTTSGAPRTNMEMAAWGREFLGWNLKWVAGYRGTNDVFLALDRGEVDMTSSSNLAPVAKLIASGRFKVLVQSGALKEGRLVGRPDFGDAPLLPVLLAGRIKDPVAVAAFDYWMTVHSGPDKWLALPPATPEPVAAAYREAFRRMLADPDFIERSRKLNEDFTPMFDAEVATWMQALARAPDNAISFMAEMTRRQGARGE